MKFPMTTFTKIYHHYISSPQFVSNFVFFPFVYWDKYPKSSDFYQEAKQTPRTPGSLLMLPRGSVLGGDDVR